MFQANVIKDWVGFYPNGCKKIIPCNLLFIAKKSILTEDVYDVECPEKIINRAGDIVLQGTPNSINIILLKSKTGYVIISNTIEQYLGFCSCCISEINTEFSNEFSNEFNN